MNYGKALKVARAIAGIQQKELAFLADTDPSHISLIEMGKRTPSVNTLGKLTRALNIPIHVFTLLAAEPRDLKIADPQELKRATESLAHLILNVSAHSRKRRAKRRFPQKA